MFWYQGNINIKKAKKFSVFSNFWKSLCKMLGDLHTLFYIEPFELYTFYPPFLEEAEAQMERKSTGRSQHKQWVAQWGFKSRCVLLTLNPRLFAYSIMLWTHEWMAEWAGILQVLVCHSMTVPDYFPQRGTTLPKMTPHPTPNIALLLEPIIFDLSNLLYFLPPTYCLILEQSLDSE